MPTIKKYENRRLYDSEGSRYVNLEDIAAMVRRGESVTVSDVKTGRDLTRETLLQVLLAAEGGPELLPVGLLRRVIRATGTDPMQRLLRPHVASAMDLMHGQLDELEVKLTRSFPSYGQGASPFAAGNPFAGGNPWAAAAASAAAASSPPPAPPPPPEDVPDDADERGAPPEADDDLAALRKRLDGLEARLKRG